MPTSDAVMPSLDLEAGRDFFDDQKKARVLLDHNVTILFAHSMPPSSSVCLLCQYRAVSQDVFRPRNLPLQVSRALSQISQRQQRRQPARMTLSPKVASPAQTGRDGRGKLLKPSGNSPFGGMNQSVAQFNRPGLHKRSSAQEKRSTRGRTFGEEKEQRSNEDTFHALKMQRSLATVPYGARNVTKARIADIETFEHFAFLPTVQKSIPTQALIGNEELVPSPIQRLAIPALLGTVPGRRKTNHEQEDGSEEFLVAAETGTGKTLAYVLPVINTIKAAELAEKEEAASNLPADQEKRKYSPYFVEAPIPRNSPHSTTGRPRAIILVPTSELVDQVTKVLKSFSHTVKFRAAGISAAYSPQVIRNRVFSPSGIDVLVSTPHLLSSITTSDPNVLSRVTHLVVDEADSLMDRSFAPITSEIIQKSASSRKQLIMCSATIPRSLDTYLRGHFPEMRRLVTPNLHAIPRRVQLGVVDVVKDPYRGNKDLACADTIFTIGKAGVDSTTGESSSPYAVKHMLVFVNEREKTEELSEYLRSKGIDAVALHRDTGEERRTEVLSQFTTQPVADAVSGDNATGPAAAKNFFPPGVRRPLQNVKVLVTTDLGSRGIDTLAVRHVILYDVPHSTIDFIHRLGRTGRMGRRGRGIVLVGKGDRRDVVREVKEGMFRGQALI
jgi:ATP-dependent RNA helicase MRH4